MPISACYSYSSQRWQTVRDTERDQTTSKVPACPGAIDHFNLFAKFAFAKQTAPDTPTAARISRLVIFRAASTYSETTGDRGRHIEFSTSCGHRHRRRRRRHHDLVSPNHEAHWQGRCITFIPPLKIVGRRDKLPGRLSSSSSGCE